MPSSLLFQLYTLLFFVVQLITVIIEVYHEFTVEDFAFFLRMIRAKKALFVVIGVVPGPSVQ